MYTVTLPQPTNIIPSSPTTIAGNIQTPYDNDVTLLYKWANIAQLPTRFIIIRARTSSDVENLNGTTNHIFESLSEIMLRLINAGESPSSIYDVVTSYRPLISMDDIIMVYYGLINNSEIPDPNLYAVMNQVYRNMDNTLTVNKFEDQDSIQRDYSAWIERVTEEKDNELKQLIVIEDIQERLALIDQEDKIPFSPVTINSSISSFSPNIDGRPVSLEDGLDIFNRTITSKYVPYIRYNDKYGKAMSRVYTGGKTETEPNYSVTVISPTDGPDPNTIYMRLWLGDPNNDGSVELHDAPRDSFSIVKYRLENNYLTIESPAESNPKKGLIRNERIAYQRTQNALPNLTFGEGKEAKVRGEFNMWNISINETPFLHMILVEPLMNVYLYVEENIKPFALKKRLDVHYRSIFTDMSEGKTGTDQAYIANSASVSITLTQKVTTETEIIDIVDPITGQITQIALTASIPYVHVNISQSDSRHTVNEFIPIFRLLMKYFLNHQQEYMVPYQIFLPELDALEPLLDQRKYKTIQTEGGPKKTGTRKLGSKIAHLRERAPELITLGFARKCQAPLQPIIVNANEIEAWKQQRIGPSQEERQVMPFPKDNPRWFFVCPDDNNPYPKVKLNTDLSNREEYPYIPCCGGKDQMTPGVKSKYRNYVENKPIPKKIGAKAEGKITTEKILEPGKIAFLPRAVETILKQYSEDVVDMVRYGIVYSTNSLIHCVCTAIDDPNYINLSSDDQKEAYVTRIRQYMLGTIRPSLLKQEFYDYTDDEIMNMFRDNSNFFDPALFYRAIEETFNVNIYIFSPPPDKNNLGIMDIPRFKIFHAHALRLHRPTILIMKTKGSESDSLEYPQCELIVDYDIDNLQITKLFGPEMTEICHGTLQETLKTVTWSVLPNNTFEVHSNMYYYIDHLSLFQLPAISQFIDDNGKMRALTLNVGNGRSLTVAVIPSQPENLPVTTEIVRIDQQIARGIFGEPTGITRDFNNNINGLWYQIMDITYGEYIPIIPVSTIPEINNLQVGPPNPIVSTGISVTSRLSKLRRTLNIITQLVKWLYELARSKQTINPDTFAQRFMVADETPVQDSSNYYNLINIPRRLPVVETIEEAIRILQPLTPTLFNQGHIVMYNHTFASKIIKMLQDYDNLYPIVEAITFNIQSRVNQLCSVNTTQAVTELRNIGIQLKIPNPHSLSKTDLCNAIRLRYKDSIDNYYETDDDFINIPNSKIFLNERDLTAWIMSLKSSQNYSKYFNIKKKIEIGMGFLKDPFIYQDTNDKIYIVQNVAGGTKAKTLATAYTWSNSHVNLGSEPSLLENIVPILSGQVIPSHMIYGISPSSTLVPIEDNTYNNTIYLKLVYYGTPSDRAIGREARYGALLEIL